MTDTDIELDYAFLTQQALRGVIRDVLEITRDLGDVPGDHHFYIEFLTQAPGVTISPDLIKAYPERMTIVLQKKFENLVVDDDHFEVTLHFKGIPDHLVIPYAAITAFVDPSVEFKLRFEPVPFDPSHTEQEELSAAELQGTSADDDGDNDDDPPGGSAPDGGADVVSLDSFRKK
ncbi:SspB family protein [Aquisalinus flavus]|uniref:Stringent starvation protein B n=1 Tax=Aquisalinus flavus TaxID=1526572 RepID=A0A8J2Y3A2_9PROT|nr:ClpXP protease specificity-enhancing factor SspB [Aquisalinus flavus]MBD0427478.1 hypothetical protein [Aquisalinus flavus]UNE47275.1 hypothetical protein FF099_03980 [Aquisalinus flavus]GGD01302.1 hypothetical protein GCM10011342_07910 [Aquisalinus flavus]